MSLAVMTSQQQNVGNTRKRTLMDMWGIKPSSPVQEVEEHVQPAALRIVLKLPSEALAQVASRTKEKTKKRLHPFFIKKTKPQKDIITTSSSIPAAGRGVVVGEQQQMVYYNHPREWNYHVRSMTPHEIDICTRSRTPAQYSNTRRPVRLGKKVASIREEDNHAGINITTTPTTDNEGDVTPVKIPKRRVMTCKQVQELALTHVDDKNLAPMCKRASKLAPFDQYLYDTTMWISKYYYHYCDCITTPPQVTVYEWLEKHQGTHKNMTSIKESSLKKKRKKKKIRDSDRSLDGFICYSDEEDQEELTSADDVDKDNRNYLLLHGPVSSGKTMAVHQAASKLDFLVFKVDDSQRRSAKDLMDQFGEMANNHLVKKSKDDAFKSKGLILLEDVDILFEDEANMWEAVEKFSGMSKRPIIMTCQDLDRVPLGVTRNHHENLVQFNRSTNVDWLWLVCLAQGHLIDKPCLEKLLVQKNHDMVAALCQLQFWCQIGIGSRFGSFDWQKESPHHDDDVRILSQQTYHDGLDNSAASSPSWNVIPSTEFSLQDYDKFYHFRSCADVIDSKQTTLFELDQSYPPKDEIITLKTLDTRDSFASSHESILDESCEPSFSNAGALDLAIQYLTSKQQSFIFAATTTKTAPPSQLRALLNPLSKPATWFNDYTLLNTIDCSTTDTLGLEIAPFARFIATLVKWRCELLHKLKSTNSNITSTRRSTSQDEDRVMTKSKSNAARIIVQDPDSILSN